MKVLFCCDAHGTGFSSAGSVIINELMKVTNWDVYLFALNMFSDENTIKEKSMKVYNLPKDKIYTPLLPYRVRDQIHPFNKEIISNALYGLYNIGEICEKLNPDILFLFNDLYPVEWLERNINRKKWKGKVVAYIPIDCEIGKGALKNHMGIDKIIAVTKHGAKCMANTGYKKPLEVIYHPVKESFRILNKDEIIDYRKKLLGEKHINKFIVINSNKNQFRKRQDLTIEGFSIFAKNKKDVALFLKCELCEGNDSGRYNIKKLLEENMKKHNLNPEDQIIVNTENITYDEINILYNICDLGLNTTSGEGFGYVPVEFAKIGKPFLVSNNTSYPELFENYEGLIPCVKSIPMVSMNHINEVLDDSFVIILQCYRKKFQSDEDDIRYVSSFDNQLAENYEVNDIQELTNLFNNLSKNKNLLLFQISTRSGLKMSSVKKLLDNIKIPRWILDNFVNVMIDKNVFKIIHEGHQLNSYIPTAKTVADKLEEFYQYWKKGQPMPLAKTPKEIEKDFVINKFKNSIEEVFLSK